MKKILATVIFLNILFFGFISVVQAQEPHVVQLPNSIDEAKTMGQGILPSIPGILKNIGNDGFAILKDIFNFVKNSWNKYIYPEIKKYIIPSTGQKDINLKEEFNKEKEEMQQSAKTEGPKAAQGLWDKIKGIGR
jgi:hypothetical protein